VRAAGEAPGARTLLGGGLRLAEEGVYLHIRDMVDRNETLGAPHVHARHVSPLQPVMPLAWFIVETNDSELSVFARPSVPRVVEGQLILLSMLAERAGTLYH
jgi:predicted lipid carrier protein YhbT